MRVIQKIRQVIAQEPQHPTAQVFSRLISGLEDELDFPLNELYKLNTSDFQLAMEILQEWRLDRYYLGKSKTFDMTLQALPPTKHKP
jgi:hypothetical protein